MLFTILSTVLTAVHFLGFSSGVAGQETEVVCGSNYTWADNSLNQNPCQVASYLQGVCNAGSFDVQILPPDEHYAPPVVNECECNTVVYSLISACADCQGGFYLTWADWSVNCTLAGTFVGTFPEAIPAGTAVPAWAYLNVLNAGRYSPLAAQADSGPESTAPTHIFPSTTATSASSTKVVNPLTTATSGDTTTAAPGGSTAAAAASGSSTKKNNTGAIVGGVVGGLAIIAIFAGLVMFFITRSRKSRIAPSTAYLDSTAPLATPPPMAQYPAAGAFAVQQSDGSSGMMPPSTISPPPGSQYSADPFLPPRPYDPSDPSTFPADLGTTPGYPSQGYSSQPSSQGYPSQPGSPAASQTNSSYPQYRGTPQV